jgi:hypothetical protein
MAKSNIIKELANSTVDTATALKRTKVLLTELGNEDLLLWVNYELAGYPKDVPLPGYRIISGSLMGSYWKGSLASHMVFNNVSISTGKMPKEEREILLNVRFTEGVAGLHKLIELSDNRNSQIIKNIPADWFPIIANYNEDLFMQFTSVGVVVDQHYIQDMLFVIENKLLDVLLLLEKEFGVLDELDIDIESKQAVELETIVKKIYLIFYNDNRVSVGDNNRIKDSTIASVVEE